MARARPVDDFHRTGRSRYPDRAIESLRLERALALYPLNLSTSGDEIDKYSLLLSRNCGEMCVGTFIDDVWRSRGG